MPKEIKHHVIEFEPTDLFGCDSGRRRWRVVCRTCKIELHEATTGPGETAKNHIVNNFAPYSRPLEVVALWFAEKEGLV